jgi:hypothetical protein
MSIRFDDMKNPPVLNDLILNQNEMRSDDPNTPAGAADSRETHASCST